MLKFQQESEDLLDATLDMGGEIVAAQIEKIHEEYVSAIQYNNENFTQQCIGISLFECNAVLFSNRSGNFLQDVGSQILCLFQKAEYRNDYPALVVELKWNKSAVSALQQIKDKKLSRFYSKLCR